MRHLPDLPVPEDHDPDESDALLEQILRDAKPAAGPLPLPEPETPRPSFWSGIRRRWRRYAE